MPLAREVGHVASDIVLDGDPAPPEKGQTPPLWPMSIVSVFTARRNARIASAVLATAICSGYITQLRQQKPKR